MGFSPLILLVFFLPHSRVLAPIFLSRPLDGQRRPPLYPLFLFSSFARPGTGSFPFFFGFWRCVCKVALLWKMGVLFPPCNHAGAALFFCPRWTSRLWPVFFLRPGHFLFLTFGDAAALLTGLFRAVSPAPPPRRGAPFFFA